MNPKTGRISQFKSFYYPPIGDSTFRDVAYDEKYFWFGVRPNFSDYVMIYKVDATSKETVLEKSIPAGTISALEYFQGHLWANIYPLNDLPHLYKFDPDNTCTTPGQRKSGKYCSEEKVWIQQKQTEEICKDDFECRSDICTDGSCQSKSPIIKPLVYWILGILLTVLVIAFIVVIILTLKKK